MRTIFLQNCFSHFILWVAFQSALPLSVAGKMWNHYFLFLMWSHKLHEPFLTLVW